MHQQRLLHLERQACCVPANRWERITGSRLIHKMRSFCLPSTPSHAPANVTSLRSGSLRLHPERGPLHSWVVWTHVKPQCKGGTMRPETTASIHHLHTIPSSAAHGRSPSVALQRFGGCVRIVYLGRLLWQLGLRSLPAYITCTRSPLLLLTVGPRP